MSKRACLLTDDEVISIIIRGYHLVEAEFPAGFNETVYEELQQLKENPGDGTLARVPKLSRIYDHPKVRGALISLLGEDVRMNSHRHCTVTMPGTHFRNAPTERMATYANFREQVSLTVKAGTVAITHYDLWHAASENRGSRTRYMLKFLFNRGSEPKAPSWDNDPERAKALLHRFSSEKACVCSQSDDYKERGLRREMWKHLLGDESAT